VNFTPVEIANQTGDENSRLINLHLGQI